MIGRGFGLGLTGFELSTWDPALVEELTASSTARSSDLCPLFAHDVLPADSSSGSFAEVFAFLRFMYLLSTTSGSPNSSVPLCMRRFLTRGEL